MTNPRTRAEHALAALIAEIRPDWQVPGILAQLRRRPTTPIEQLAAAALAATTRTDQRTPHLIADDEGAAWDRLIGRTTPTPDLAPRQLTCHRHGPHDGTTCPQCAQRIADHATAAAAIHSARETIRHARETNTP